MQVELAIHHTLDTSGRFTLTLIVIEENVVPATHRVCAIKVIPETRWTKLDINVLLGSISIPVGSQWVAFKPIHTKY